MSPRVYVVNYHNHDLSSLSQFSPEQPIILAEGNVPLVHATQQQLAERLKDFRPDTDYIVPSGSPVLSMMVSAILKDTFEIDSWKILCYNKRLNAYTVKHIDGYVPEFHKDCAK